MKQPVLFIGHGSPMNALESSSITQSWKNLAQLQHAPDAIVVISAHWLTRGSYISANAAPKTIYDFSGFPQELYQVRYECPGSPGHAEQISRLLSKTDNPCLLDNSYGLDHGAWAVLVHMFPERQIPVLQISIDYGQSMQWHYQRAKALQGFREQNILFIASGNIAHNIAKWRVGNTDTTAEMQLDDIVLANLEKRAKDENDRELVDYPALGDWVQEPIPEPDHYIPFIYSLGLSGPEEAVTYNISDTANAMERMMRSIRFG